MWIKSKTVMSGVRKRKKSAFFVYFIWSNLFYHLCFVSVYNILNKLAEYQKLLLRTLLLLVFKILKWIQQAFINYSLLCTRFRAFKIALLARPFTWEIRHAKEQTCTLLKITWYISINRTKLLLKPVAARNGLCFSPVYCSFPVYYATSVYMMNFLHSCTVHFLFTEQRYYFLINLNEEQCSKFNMLTMDHEFVLENSSLAGAYTLPNTIIYLKAIKYLNVRVRQIY